MQDKTKTELKEDLARASRVYKILVKTLEELDKAIKEIEENFRKLDTE